MKERNKFEFFSTFVQNTKLEFFIQLLVKSTKSEVEQTVI